MYKKLLILKVLACLLFTGFSLNAGVLEQLFWDNVFNSDGGRTTAVEDLRAFPDFPDSPVDSLDLDTAAGFSTPRGQGDDFGSLIKGYIVSPVSGDVTFYTASDDNSEFLLSSDDHPANLQLLGKETGCCTGLFDGARLDERSGTVTLEAGGIYYFEALYKEGGGGDWMDIGWELPDGTQEIIPAGALLPAPSPARPAGSPQADFLHFPVDHFVSESTLVSFRVDLFGSVAGMKFQWKKNGADIAGATLPWITIIAELVDDGALFTLNVQSDASGANGVDFDGGSIFVEADIDAPEILAVNSSAEPHGFIIQYNELVTEATATDLGNYTFSGQTIDVQGVRMLDGASVVIETGNFTDEATSLRISGIKDLSEAGNTVTATTVDIAFALPGALYLFYEGNPISMYPAADRGKGLYPLTFNPFDASVMGNQDNFSARASSTMPYLEVPNTGDITVNPDSNVQDQYGILMIGYIVPKVTATYHFYIASDDNAFLYLSTDENPENTIEIARENVWNAVRDWNGTDGDVNKSPTEHPDGFDLTAGQRYYFEAINQEGGGGDNFAIAWNTSGVAPETGDGSQIITGEFLQSAVNSGELSIDVQPVSAVGTEGKAATFSVQVSGSDPLAFNYVWYKNDEPVRGETEAEYTIEVLGQEDNNAQIRVEVFNTNGTYSRLVSDTVELTVDNDVLSPEIVTVNSDPLKTNVIVVFNEDVDAASVENIGAYSIIAEDGSELSVTGATFDGTRQVVINTAEQGDGVIYTLTVNGVTDISGNTNAGNPSKNFSSHKFGPGGLTVLFYEDGGAGITFYDEPRGINVFPENYNQFGAASPPSEGTIGAIAARESHVATYFETPATGDIDTAPQSDVADNYGAVLFGYLQPEVTGTYRFFLAVDDNAELYLSTDENPANSQLIAAEANWSQVRTWANREPADDELFDGPNGTTSDPIELVADQRYYIEGIFSEGGGGDNFAVAWSFTSDGTDPGRPANGSNPIPGEFLLSNLPVFLIDDDVIIDITQQPTDQIGVLASQGLPLVSNDFNSSDGGYTVETEGDVPGPWVYDAASGSWIADGSESGGGGPYHSLLNSSEITLSESGAVTLNFSHRYAFEGDLWDGGQVRISVNGGEFTTVPPEAFSANGYAPGVLQGNGLLNGQSAFNGQSAGYSDGEFITSTAALGNFNANDTLVVQFAGGWDEAATGTNPNWVIDAMDLVFLPITSQDFAIDDGGYTVETVGDVPGPWVYDPAQGLWIADGSNADCGGPYHSLLNSPIYTVPQNDEVTLNFSHRYAFEGDQWDGGQVRLSVNGGAFSPVSAEIFTANGYAPTIMRGSSIVGGQYAFNGPSAGYSDGEFITSSAVLGRFSADDTLVIQFAGGWDDCSTGTNPNWVIQDLQLVFGSAAQAVEFTVAAEASRLGDPIGVNYQWQRNDGDGFVDIAGANGTTHRFFPTAEDFGAEFLVIVSAQGTINTTNTEVATLTDGEDPGPGPGPDPVSTIGISTDADGNIVLTYEGALLGANNVEGPYEEVDGASSPMTIAPDAARRFYQSSN